MSLPNEDSVLRASGHRGPFNRREQLLIVDDGLATRATLSAWFDRVGYRSCYASSGAEALEMLRGGLQADAIVYDAGLPDMSGTAFVRQLHSDGNLTPVLVMTAARGAEPTGADAPDAAIARPFQLVDFGDKLLGMFAARRSKPVQ